VHGGGGHAGGGLAAATDSRCGDGHAEGFNGQTVSPRCPMDLFFYLFSKFFVESRPWPTTHVRREP
jgi:hypothetical protein